MSNFSDAPVEAEKTHFVLYFSVLFQPWFILS